MNRDAMELWLGALEGDEYEQTRYTLRRILENGHVNHCALGVLVEVAGRQLGRDLWNSSDDPLSPAYDWLGVDACGPSVHFDAEELPDELPLHAGDLKEQLRLVPRVGVVFVNDFAQESFPEIAQRLRKEYL